MTGPTLIGRRAAVLAAAASILSAAAYAAPAPTYYGTGTVYADPGFVDPVFIASGAGLQLADGTQPPGLSATPTSDLLVTYWGGLTASSSYSSAPGLLTGKSFAAVEAPVSRFAPDRTVSAAADARLRDYLEVLAPTPGATGSATLTFSLVLEGTLSAPGVVTGAAAYMGGTSVLAKFGATWTDASGADGACLPVCGIEAWAAKGNAGDGYYSIASQETGTFSITVPYGTVVQIDALLLVGSGMIATEFANGTIVSAEQALRLYVDTAPGVTLASATGYDYATPIPEPSTSALALSGLVLLAAARLRPQR